MCLNTFYLPKTSEARLLPYCRPIFCRRKNVTETKNWLPRRWSWRLGCVYTCDNNSAILEFSTMKKIFVRACCVTNISGKVAEVLYLWRGVYTLANIALSLVFNDAKNIFFHLKPISLVKFLPYVNEPMGID